VKWFHKSAAQGNAEAQYWLGKCYFRGIGVAQDSTMAVDFFHAAAEQGKMKAQCRLGKCYLMGEGVSQNFAEARKWLQKAKEQGCEESSIIMQQTVK
jgi:TPR repeat protein